MIKGDPNWSEEYLYCRICYKTNHNHVMEGYCQKCFNAMELEKKKVKKDRFCLKCGIKFQSNGPGNRRCDICLRKDSGSKYRHKLIIN